MHVSQTAVDVLLHNQQLYMIHSLLIQPYEYYLDPLLDSHSPTHSLLWLGFDVRRETGGLC